MKGIFSIFRKDDKAFTGLESAIVLTAFVVVAAVFSYVVLGAGFTTSDTAKKTIDEGVKQTTSSVELAGDVVATCTDPTTSATVNTIIVTLQLTAGQSPVDIGAGSDAGMLVVSYADSAIYSPEVTWSSSFIGDNDKDTILEQHEKVQLSITVPNADPIALLATPGSAENTEFRLEIKPKVGAIVPVTRVTPAQIDKVMVLK